MASVKLKTIKTGNIPDGSHVGLSDHMPYSPHVITDGPVML